MTQSLKRKKFKIPLTWRTWGTIKNVLFIRVGLKKFLSTLFSSN